MLVPLNIFLNIQILKRSVAVRRKIFWLKNRQSKKFMDKREVEHTGEVKSTEKERNERMRSIRNIVGATDISEN